MKIELEANSGRVRLSDLSGGECFQFPHGGAMYMMLNGCHDLLRLEGAEDGYEEHLVVARLEDGMACSFEASSPVKLLRVKAVLEGVQ